MHEERRKNTYTNSHSAKVATFINNKHCNLPLQSTNEEISKASHSQTVPLKTHNTTIVTTSLQ
jgi:hypothetical protein